MKNYEAKIQGSGAQGETRWRIKAESKEEATEKAEFFTRLSPNFGRLTSVALCIS